MDRIFIDQLEIDTVIGVYDWERKIRQRVSFDIEMAFDIRAAAAADDVNLTLSYKDVAKRIIAFVEASAFELVETLAERVAQIIIGEFGVQWVSLRLNKPMALRGAQGVGVHIVREAKDAAAANVFVGVGSNIEPFAHIPQALKLLEQRFGPLRLSQTYRCPAVGFDGDPFVNLVVGFETTQPPLAVTLALRDIEQHCGRKRNEKMRSRTLDLDLLLHDNSVVEHDGLHLPRRDILEYAFVLKPLAAMIPDAIHPVAGRSYADLWADFDASEQPLTPVSLK